MVSYSSGSGFVFIRGWFCAARRWNVIKWYNLLVIQMKGGRFVCCCSIFMTKEHSSLESLDSVSVGWDQSAAFHNQQRIFLVWDKTYDFLNISKSLELHFLAWSPEKKKYYFHYCCENTCCGSITAPYAKDTWVRFLLPLTGDSSPVTWATRGIRLWNS